MGYKKLSKLVIELIKLIKNRLINAEIPKDLMKEIEQNLY